VGPRGLRRCRSPMYLLVYLLVHLFPCQLYVLQHEYTLAAFSTSTVSKCTRPSR